MLLVVEYQVNKNYIATVLCINKDRPQLKCEGKCQLTKELKAAEKHDEKLPAPIQEILEVVYFFQPVANAFTIPFSAAASKSFAQYKAGLVSSPAFAVFHPPCFLV